jgi:DNA (cytosine-5)-methyltransferase 1
MMFVAKPNRASSRSPSRADPLPMTMPHDPPGARMVSLFSGAGGLDLGFRDAGFRLLWANDHNADACATFAHNLGAHIVPGSIHDIPSDAIPACDVVIGGPPCQGFSVAGKMDAADPRSRLVWEFIRIVADKRPRAFVMENVAALARLRRWAEARKEIQRQFYRLGYDVEMVVLDASDFGVPQQRERVFFFGRHDGPAADLIPEPTGPRVSLRQALRDLPRLGEPGNDGICRAKVVPAKKPVLRRSPYAGMLFNGLGRPIDLDGPAPTLPASMGGNKTPIIDQLALDTGEPAWVVGYHAHLIAGGEPYRAAPSFLRRLTVQECARLQTFPAGFVFRGNQSSQYCQIGNAVPPLLAAAIAARVRQALTTASRLNRPSPALAL